MKLKRLDLIAYGPFSERTIDFSSGNSNLHIVYGLNEAGKSSVLRAIRDVLYGIPVQTQDNFLHDNRKLRIGAELQDVKGNTFSLVRRKGNKNTLLSPDGEKLPDSALAPWTLGVPRELFVSLFGISHSDLTQGGEEILRQQGEVGQALFSASSASKGLHRVLSKLNAEADDLFKPQGSKQQIAEEISRYNDIKQQISEHSLGSKQWSEKQKAFDTVSQELTQLQTKIHQYRTNLSERERSDRLLPKLAQRQDLLDQLQAYQGISPLADDFAKRHADVARELRVAETAYDTLHARHAIVEKNIQDHSAKTNILSNKESILQLYQSLQSYTSASDQLPMLQQEHAHLQTQFKAHLATLDPTIDSDTFDQLLPILSKESTIQRLARQALETDTRQQQILAQLSDLSSKQQLLTDSLKDNTQATPDEKSLQSLAIVLQRLRSHGDLDSVIIAVQTRLSSTLSAFQQACKRLPLWQGLADEIFTLAVPARESVRQFQLQFADLESVCKSQSQRLQSFQEEKQTIREQQKELELEGQIPQAQQLQEARVARDNAWALVKSAWLEQKDVAIEAGFLDPSRPLNEAFQWRMMETDRISDLLLHNSARVAKQAELQLRRQNLEQKISESAIQLDDIEQRQHKLDEQWQSLWQACQIKPTSPNEMLEWLAQYQDVLRLGTELKQLETEHQTYVLQRDEAIKELQKTAVLSTGASSESLGSLLDQAQSQLMLWQKAHDETAHKQNAIKETANDILRTQNTLDALSHEQELWQKAWSQLLTECNLDERETPETVMQRLQLTRDAKNQRDRIKALASEIATLRSTVNRFQKEYQHLGLEDQSLTAVLHVKQLYQTLELELQQDSLYRENLRVLASIEDELVNAERQKVIAKRALQALLLEANCKSESELMGRQQQSQQLSILLRRIADKDQEILADSGGFSLKDIESMLKAVSIDDNTAEIADIRTRLENELEPQQQILFEDKGRLQKELELMNGSDNAAVLAEQAQDSAARIEKLAQRYLRLKTAARLLSNELERFREKNQAPLLAAASDYFSTLTLGSFSQLKADFDTDDDAILLAIRSNGEAITVEGMSNGTRDQLFLALRLAALSQFIEENGPLPFIVDDILIEFDDSRSAAALQILTGIAKKTQVILFTHHPRLLELSQSLETAVSCHEL